MHVGKLQGGLLAHDIFMAHVASKQSSPQKRDINKKSHPSEPGLAPARPVLRWKR